MKICSVEGCGKFCEAKDFCLSHYKKFRRHGDPEYKSPPPVKGICAVPGCGKTCHGQGYCSTHYVRFRRHGDPNAKFKPYSFVSPRLDGLRVCARCETTKPLRDFYPREDPKTKSWCMSCIQDYDKARREANPLRKREIERRSGIKYRFGITRDDWEKMYASQQGACAICKRKGDRKLCVDHCHTTGKIRGLLCNACNSGIGFLRDSIPSLKAAIAYLKRTGLDGGLE